MVSQIGHEVYHCSCTDMQAQIVLVTCKSQDTPAAFEKGSGVAAVGSHINNLNGLYCRCFIIHMCMCVHVCLRYIQTCTHVSIRLFIWLPDV